MATDTKSCVACSHEIDVAARICPYCGADPASGEKLDTRPIVEAHFPPRGEMSTAQRVLEYFRERQALVVVAVVVTVYLLLGAAHQMVARRNAALEATAPAVPLTDLTDLNEPVRQSSQLPIPEMEFQYTGDPRTMDVMLIEPGAAAPPPEPEETATAAVAPRQGPPRPRG